MKFIVCGDNHGKKDPMTRLLENYPEVDDFLHMGDVGFPKDETKEFKIVNGNNDFFFGYPEELVVTVGTKRIYMTHGHHLAYGDRLRDLAQRAKDRNCEIACFGHTHVYQVEDVDGILCINPGSLSHNRDGRAPSYAEVTIENDEINVVRKEVKNLK